MVDAVRKEISPNTIGWQEWASVMREAHCLEMPTTATMMFGVSERSEDIVEHLFRVREVQARTGGFTAFITWPLQPEHTEMEGTPKTDAVTHLRTVAVARLVLDNVPNLQASWVTMGLKVGQIALRFGCNDFGSLMIEENVVSAAGTTHGATLDEIVRHIRDAGFTPARRQQDYTIVPDTVAV